MTNNNPPTNNRFKQSLFDQLPIFGILRGYTSQQVENIVTYACRGGLTNIEITMNSPNATRLIQLAIDIADGAMNVGAGTVCDLNDLRAALSAGASFIVTPIVNADVIKACNREKIPIIAGALTPTEIHTASRLGADMIKVFPINHFGPGYIKDIKAPLKHIKLIPTGGVKQDNFRQYLKCGADGFGIASPLFNKEKVEADNWDWVQRQVELFKDMYREYQAEQ